MPNYTTRTVAVVVGPEGSTVLDDSTTKVHIEDEGAGEYVVVSQCIREEQSISITADEWPAIRDAIEAMLKECRNDD